MEAYRNGEKIPTAIDLHRELNILKKGELSWMYEVSKCAPQEALRNLDQAYAHFFRRVKAKKAGRKIQAGFPKFKSKKNGLGSFRLTGAIHIYENAIQLPRLGLLRLKEHGYLPVEGAHICVDLCRFRRTATGILSRRLLMNWKLLWENEEELMCNSDHTFLLTRCKS